MPFESQEKLRKVRVSKKNSKEIDCLIGKRLREARVYAGISLVTAAKHFGYENGSRLNKIESGEHAHHELIIQAALLYGISTDYLFGLCDNNDGMLNSDEMVKGCSSVMAEYFTRERIMVQKSLEQTLNYILRIQKAVNEVPAAVLKIDHSLERFAELNPTFEDEMRGGSNLLHSVAEAKRIVGRVVDIATFNKANIIAMNAQENPALQALQGVLKLNV